MKSIIFKFNLLIIQSVLLFSTQAFAINPIMMLTLGASNSLNTQSPQTLNVDNNIFVYSPHSSSGLTRLIGGFVGAEYAINNLYAWQFGLAYYQSAEMSISGEETQAPAENSNAINYWDYRYQTSHQKLVFENKISYTMKKDYHPYVSVGLGESFNQISGFQVTPRNSGEVATVIYKTHQNHSFTYTLGFGVDADVLKHMRIGLGYRFTDLGKFNSGPGTLDTGIGGEVFNIPALKPSSVLNQEVLIQLTYII